MREERDPAASPDTVVLTTLSDNKLCSIMISIGAGSGNSS